MINGPKIKAAEPMCINEPITGELIADIKMHTLNKKAKISDKDYRLWYMLKENYHSGPQ